MKRIVVVLMSMLSLAGCGRNSAPEGASPASGEGRPSVEVTNYPLAYFAERMLAGALPVHFRAPEEGDPAFWKPSDADVAAMQQAGVILTNGATYEKWLDQVSLPQSLIVDTAAGFKTAYITVEEAATHSHGPGEAHAHGGTAFTTWMDLTQAMQQVAAVEAALKPLLPESEQAGLAARGQQLRADLEELNARMKEVAARMSGVTLMASHPVYQYWARGYGLEVTELHWEPDVLPDEEQKKELEVALAAKPSSWMIWEGEPLAESVEMLKAKGIASLVVDPCGNRPEAGDFLNVMEANLAVLEKAFP